MSNFLKKRGFKPQGDSKNEELLLDLTDLENRVEALEIAPTMTDGTDTGNVSQLNTTPTIPEPTTVGLVQLVETESIIPFIEVISNPYLSIS